MHLETLLYMLVQSDKILPPPGAAPDFASLSKQARMEQVPNEWVHIPAQNLALGLDDSENGSGLNRYFGWDNEKPQRRVAVQPFEAKARPITNEDFAHYLEKTQQPNLPAMWTVSDRESGIYPIRTQGDGPTHNRLYMNGHSEALTKAYPDGKSVKTVYGPVPLKYALDWPMIASYDELLGCAKWMGGRIPTFEEVQSIYTHVRLSKTKEVELVQTRIISAVNGYVSFNMNLRARLDDSIDISPITAWTSLLHLNLFMKVLSMLSGLQTHISFSLILKVATWVSNTTTLCP